MLRRSTFNFPGQDVSKGLEKQIFRLRYPRLIFQACSLHMDDARLCIRLESKESRLHGEPVRLKHTQASDEMVGLLEHLRAISEAMCRREQLIVIHPRDLSAKDFQLLSTP